MTGMKEWSVVIPGWGEIGAVARALLDLADDPTHVRTSGNGSEFLVPPYLADRYNQASPEPEPDTEPVRRPRRRLKKQED